MSDSIGQGSGLPAREGESTLVKAGAAAEIGALIVAVLSLPWYLWTAGPSVSILVLLLIVCLVGILGVAAAYLGTHRTEGPSSNAIDWLRLVQRYDNRMKIYVGVAPPMRYGVVLDDVLSDLRAFHLLAVAYNHDKLAEALERECQILMAEKKTNESATLDPKFEEAIRRAISERALRNIRKE